MRRILHAQTLGLDEVVRTLIPLASEDMSVGSCVVFCGAGGMLGSFRRRRNRGRRFMLVARVDDWDATLARSVPSLWMGGGWWGRWIFFGLVVLLTDLRGAETPDNDDFVKVRARVITDYDFRGDPDGLFQLAQQLLSPSVEVPGVIGSHHYATGFYGDSGDA